MSGTPANSRDRYPMAQRTPPRKLDADALLQYALAALGRRALSAGELRDKLARRAQSPTDIPAILDRLKEYGYLDDGRFAESFANWRRDNQGFGRQRVLRDLRQRRVSPGLAEKAVEEAFASTDELAMIEDFLKRKFRGKALPAFLSEEKNLAAAYRRLRYAGFSPGASVTVLRRYTDRAAGIEETPEGDV
jgi:regulatory protein